MTNKLSNAPLQEVSAQIKWHLKAEEIDSYSFFAGDYYHFIKDSFTEREVIAPKGIPIQFLWNNPTHKFFSKKTMYPFILLGPGVVGINIDNENYSWESFREKINTSFSPIFTVVPELSEFEHVHLSLEYVNFFKFDFSVENVFKYLSNHLSSCTKISV